MYSDICLIGLGTLGGFLAKDLSELETTKNLLLIDYDTVEPKNIKNSIYSKSDIGELKTKAICKKIESDAKIHIQNEKFKEGVTKIPKCDLILDCRDFTYERKNEIDARLSISLERLIVDCRKNVSYEKQHEGKYIYRLSKSHLKMASINTTILINDGIFKELIKKQSVREFQIDSVSEEINKSLETTDDLIYDVNKVNKKLINLKDNYSSILNTNHNNDITFCLGSKTSPLTTKLIQKTKLRSLNDITLECITLIKHYPVKYNYYVITITLYRKKYYVEIIPETGAA